MGRLDNELIGQRWDVKEASVRSKVFYNGPENNKFFFFELEVKMKKNE